MFNSHRASEIDLSLFFIRIFIDKTFSRSSCKYTHTHGRTNIQLSLNVKSGIRITVCSPLWRWMRLMAAPAPAHILAATYRHFYWATANSSRITCKAMAGLFPKLSLIIIIRICSRITFTCFALRWCESYARRNANGERRFCNEPLFAHSVHSSKDRNWTLNIVLRETNCANTAQLYHPRAAQTLDAAHVEFKFCPCGWSAATEIWTPEISLMKISHELGGTGQPGGRDEWAHEKLRKLNCKNRIIASSQN